MRAMRDTPVNDFFAHNGHIRADGLMVHDMYLFQVKTPAESKGPWDYYKLVATIPGDEAFQPLSESSVRWRRRIGGFCPVRSNERLTEALPAGSRRRWCGRQLQDAETAYFDRSSDDPGRVSGGMAPASVTRLDSRSASLPR